MHILFKIKIKIQAEDLKKKAYHMVPMFKYVLKSVVAEIPIVHIKHIFIDILIPKEFGAWILGKIKSNAYIRKFASLGFLLHCSTKERTRGLE